MTTHEIAPARVGGRPVERIKVYEFAGKLAVYALLIVASIAVASPLLIALGLVLITPAGPLRAQVNGPHVSIFPWAGYANFAKNVNFKDS